MKTIKTKEKVRAINNLDKKQETKILNRKENMKEKMIIEDQEPNNQRYAVNKVVSRGKKSVAEVTLRSKKYMKRKSKEHIKQRQDINNYSKQNMRTKQSLKKDNKKYNISKVSTRRTNNLTIPNIQEKMSHVELRTPYINDYNSRMKSFMFHKHKMKVKNNSSKSGMVKKGVRGLGKTVKNSFIVIKKVVIGINNLVTFGTGLILLIVITLFIGVFGALSDDSTINSATLPLNDKVNEYRETIETYARQYEIEEYVSLIQAVMMQESGGEGTDPMQASECEYNEKYSKVPNGITDIKYSIEVGIHYLSDCFKLAEVNGPYDMEHLSLALQGYNYGKDYINWAIEHFGGYTRANAKVYSDEKKAELQVNVYGDSQYVTHVLQYYHLGDGDIVMVAKSQVGNVGGKAYWQWYGYSTRVEWCACFVSYV